MKEKELNREERNKTVMETGALVMAEFYGLVPSLPENDADREGVQGIGERKIRSGTNQYRGGERSCRFVYGGIDSYFYPATERGGFVETIRRDELG